MKSKWKLWIVSFCCIGAGIVLMGAGFAMGGRTGFYINRTGIHSSSENVSPKPYVQEKMKLDQFTSIDMDIKYADLKILPSDGYYIEYKLDGGSQEPVLEVKDQKLRFQEGASGGQVGFNFVSIGGFNSEHYTYYVTLYVPADQYFKSVTLKNNDGSMDIGSISAESLDIQDDYGDARIESFKGGRLQADMGNGSFRAEHLEADDVSISNDYGDCYIGTANMKGGRLQADMGNGSFRAEHLEADDVSMSNDYGDCYIDTANVRNLKAKLGNGSFTMDQDNGASIDVVNDYGTVKLGLTEQLKDYKMDLKTEYGAIKVPEFPELSTGKEDEGSYKYTDTGTNQVKVRCGNGDIVIDAPK